MSAAAPALGRSLSALPRAGSAAAESHATPVRLAAFAALAAFALGHWGLLVSEPPVGRMVAVLAVALLAAAALVLLGRSRLGGLPLALACLACGTLAVAAGLVIAGLPARLLAPANWSELGTNLDLGLAGLSTAEWPYAGDEDWLRQAVLLAPPLALGLAATLAFWPAARGATARRALALVLLLLLFAVPVTETQPDAQLLRGLLLMLLVAAWVWLPGLGPRAALPAAGTLLAVGLLALPLAARLDSDTPWWNYEEWHWFGSEVVGFNWEHSYGPLDWPRDGTTLLTVKSDRAHYWKVETLDSFDGFRWVRSEQNDFSRSSAEIPDPVNERWVERISFRFAALRSELLVGAGTTYVVEGVEDTLTAADGTTRVLGAPLERGAEYEISTYAPDPTGRQMRAAAPDTALALAEYTSLYLPNPGETALTAPAARAEGPPDRPRITVPLRDAPGSGTPEANHMLSASAYTRVQGLARRLTAGAPTTYDAVKRVESHLQRNYRYNERPPTQEVPLAAFLFEDRIGYCQQFSGAMALMLRMAGIPTRVVSGFSPGSPNRDTGEFRVRDLDAHSWVEVHFAGIGWVPFDPTPAAAPPELQSNGPAATSAARGDGGDALTRSSADTAPSAAPAPGGGSDGGGDSLPVWVLAVALALAGAAAGLAFAATRVRARSRLAPEEVVDAQVRELERALPRLGWRLPAGTTLLGLERRLARAAGPAASRYVGRLRAHRFSPLPAGAPGRAERRALRRELTASGGPLARLRGYLAFPPLGPRRADS